MERCGEGACGVLLEGDRWEFRAQPVGVTVGGAA